MKNCLEKDKKIKKLEKDYEQEILNLEGQCEEALSIKDKKIQECEKKLKEVIEILDEKCSREDAEGRGMEKK